MNLTRARALVLVRELKRLLAYFRRQLRPVPMLRGLDFVVRGIVASYRSRPQYAQRQFQAARKLRGDGTSIWDACIRGRLAVECYRLGERRSVVLAELDASIAILARMDVPGMLDLFETKRIAIATG